MNKRVKEIRDHFEMSQGKFGEMLNLSQRAISNIETGVSILSKRNFDAICRVFNVNENWLRNGEGEMFREPKDGLEKLREEYDLNAGDMALIKSFLELPPEMRQMVLEFGRNFAKNFVRHMPEEEERKPDDKLTVAEKRKMVNEELDAEEKGQMSYPSIGTSGLKNRNYS